MEQTTGNPFDQQGNTNNNNIILNTHVHTNNNEALGWAEQYDEHGQAYYYNIQTQETKWETPDADNDGGYWKQLWDDHQNSLFYQHSLSGQMRWTLRNENEANSENEFSSPEVTSSPKNRQTYENNHPPPQQLQFGNARNTPATSSYHAGVKINDLEEEEAEQQQESDVDHHISSITPENNNIHNIEETNNSEISNAINTAFASSVISEGLADENMSDNNNNTMKTINNVHNNNEKGILEQEINDILNNNNTTDNNTTSGIDDMIISSSSGAEKRMEEEDDDIKININNNKTKRKSQKEKKLSSTSASSSSGDNSSSSEEDEMDDEEDDDDTVFYVYQCIFLFHGCAIESPCGVIEAAFRIALHLCLVVFCAIIATVKCFSDATIDRIKFHLKEIMLYLAAATSLACCIPGGLVYRDFNTFKDDFDLLPIYTICGRVDPRRFWVFTKGQGAEALNVLSKKFPEDSMDDYQYDNKKSKYKKFGRKGSSSSSSKKRRNKRKKNKKKSSRSKSKYGKSSSRSSRVVVEMSHVLPSSSTRRSGNAKYDVEEEEEIELFSDDEMVPHHEHEIEMVDV